MSWGNGQNFHFGLSRVVEEVHLSITWLRAQPRTYVTLVCGGLVVNPGAGRPDHPIRPQLSVVSFPTSRSSIPRCPGRASCTMASPSLSPRWMC